MLTFVCHTYFCFQYDHKVRYQDDFLLLSLRWTGELWNFWCISNMGIFRIVKKHSSCPVNVETKSFWEIFYVQYHICHDMRCCHYGALQLLWMHFPHMKNPCFSTLGASSHTVHCHTHTVSTAMYSVTLQTWQITHLLWMHDWNTRMTAESALSTRSVNSGSQGRLNW